MAIIAPGTLLLNKSARVYSQCESHTSCPSFRFRNGRNPAVCPARSAYGRRVGAQGAARSTFPPAGAGSSGETQSRSSCGCLLISHVRYRQNAGRDRTRLSKVTFRRFKHSYASRGCKRSCIGMPQFKGREAIQPALRITLDIVDEVFPIEKGRRSAR